jgi:hypothetical protein
MHEEMSDQTAKEMRGYPSTSDGLNNAFPSNWRGIDADRLARVRATALT